MRKLCVILLMVAGAGSAVAGEKGQAASKPQAAAKGQAASKPQAAAKGHAASKPQAALIKGKLKGRLDLGKIRDRIKKIRG